MSVKFLFNEEGKFVEYYHSLCTSEKGGCKLRLKDASTLVYLSGKSQGILAK